MTLQCDRCAVGRFCCQRGTQHQIECVEHSVDVGDVGAARRAEVALHRQLCLDRRPALAEGDTAGEHDPRMAVDQFGHGTIEFDDVLVVDRFEVDSREPDDELARDADLIDACQSDEGRSLELGRRQHGGDRRAEFDGVDHLGGGVSSAPLRVDPLYAEHHHGDDREHHERDEVHPQR